MIRSATVVAAALLLTGAAFAGTDLSFPAFTGINLHGGGHVVLRHGAVQKVTVIKGDLKKADIHLDGKTLDVSSCKGWCWNVAELVVEITSPAIDAMEVHGGGDLEAVGEFPHQPVLNVQVHGGGDLDARAIPADTVNASVHGGGDAKVKALTAINANVHGGGDLTYTGNPGQIRSETHGGGTIHKE